MNENALQLISIAKLFWVAIFALFYGSGGISGKWKRRYVGSAWMGLGVYVFSSASGLFHWWYLLYPLLLCGALHLGYGSDNIWIKIRKRAICGLAIGVSATPLVFGSGLYLLYVAHIVLCVSCSIYLGAFNPTRNARSEETLIGGLTALLPLFIGA